MILRIIKKTFFTLTQQLLSVKVKSSFREHANIALTIYNNIYLTDESG